MQKLVLIDGHAILHRAYHALPPTLTNREGTPTNAIYGFMTMLLRVLSDLKPDYLAVAFDLPAPTFRQQMYTQYQGKRPEMEGNLTSQIPLTHELLATLKIPYFEVAGFEADDVIGTLAAQAVGSSELVVGSKKNPKSTMNYGLKTNNSPVDVVIVTGDRDMLQLVGGHTKVMVPVKGLSETKTYDEKLVTEEFGVTPAQWVDVKALKGDASDNYPGVAGIGPKTAEKLIGEYGSLEKLYGKLGELVKLDAKTAKKLAEGAESAGLSQKLARIVTDVPVHLDLVNAAVAKIDWADGVTFMREKLSFRTISERVDKEYLGKMSKDSKNNNENNDQMKLI